MRMKRFDVRTLPASFLLSAALAVSSVFCLATAFDVPVRAPLLAGLCCAGALAWAVCLSFRRSWPFVCLLLAGAAALLWRFRPEAFGGLFLTIGRVSACYHLAFGTPQPALPSHSGHDAAVFLAFVSLLPSGMTAWTVSKRLSAWPALTVCAVGPVLCFNILETVPDAWALLLFSAGALLLLLTQPLRRESVRGGGRATLCLALPAALTALALFLPVSLGAVTRPVWADGAGQQLEQAVSSLQLPGLPSDDGPARPASALSSRLAPAEPVDLTRIGPNAPGDRTALSVFSTESGPLYLRGASLGVYTGQAWTPLDSGLYDTLRAEQLAPLLSSTFVPGAADPVPQLAPLPQAAAAEQEITVRMRGTPDLLYCPYYPAALPEAAQPVDDVCYRPAGKSYTIAYAPAPAAAGTDAAYDRFVFEQYLSVPASVKPELAQLARSAGLSTISDVAAYVRACGVYDLDTPRTPEGEDFALWFLQESRTGYCVHFATAAVLLLREIGVPARYVSGYLVQTQARQWVDVTDRQAHAWAEYYTPGVGWAPLDATPAAQAAAGPDGTSVPATASDAVANTAPEPGGTAEPDDAPQKTGVFRLPRQLAIPAALVALLLAAALTQRAAVLLRRRRFRRGEPNRRALALWTHIVRLSRQTGTPPPEEAELLALRARFGPRQLTGEELNTLLRCAAALERQLRRGPAGRRLLCRWRYALF